MEDQQAPLSEQEFNAVLERVMRMAKPGSTEAEFNALLDDEARKAIAAKRARPEETLAAKRARPEEALAASDPHYQPAAAKAPALPLRAIAEHGPAIGGLVGGLAGGPGGAAVGGATGALVRDLSRAWHGDPDTPRTPLDAAANVAVHGGSQGALTKGGELLGRGALAGGRWGVEKGREWIQGAVKPSMNDLKLLAGRRGTTMDAEAKRIVNLIRRTGITTPEAAEAAIRRSESAVKSALAKVGPDAEDVTILTDAPSRAERYLNKLARDNKRQMAPPPDEAAAIADELTQLRNGPLFQSVDRTVRRPTSWTAASSSDGTFAGNLTANLVEKPVTPGSPFQTGQILSVGEQRVPRANVTPAEALELARGTSRYATRKAHGEVKSMSMEAKKALERAGRDAAKASAGPELSEALRHEGDLIRLKPVLDRMAVRRGNAAPLTLEEIIGAAPAIAHGRLPVLSLATRAMRRNQLGTGMRMANAGERLMNRSGEVGTSAEMLGRALLDLLQTREQ
jgi:hypothetical protein